MCLCLLISAMQTAAGHECKLCGFVLRLNQVVLNRVHFNSQSTAAALWFVAPVGVTYIYIHLVQSIVLAVRVVRVINSLRG